LFCRYGWEYLKGQKVFNERRMKNSGTFIKSHSPSHNVGGKHNRRINNKETISASVILLYNVF